jgi:hypothetical protein
VESLRTYGNLLQIAWEHYRTDGGKTWRFPLSVDVNIPQREGADSAVVVPFTWEYRPSDALTEDDNITAISLAPSAGELIPLTPSAEGFIVRSAPEAPYMNLPAGVKLDLAQSTKLDAYCLVDDFYSTAAARLAHNGSFLTLVQITAQDSSTSHESPLITWTRRHGPDAVVRRQDFHLALPVYPLSDDLAAAGDPAGESDASCDVAVEIYAPQRASETTIYSTPLPEFEENDALIPIRLTASNLKGTSSLFLEMVASEGIQYRLFGGPEDRQWSTSASHPSRSRGGWSDMPEENSDIRLRTNCFVMLPNYYDDIDAGSDVLSRSMFSVRASTVVGLPTIYYSPETEVSVPLVNAFSDDAPYNAEASSFPQSSST